MKISLLTFTNKTIFIYLLNNEKYALKNELALSFNTTKKKIFFM